MSAKKVTKSAAPVASKSAPAKGTVLKSICQDLKVDPKIARRKLRAAGLSFHGKRERWVFGPAQAKQAREVLQA